MKCSVALCTFNGEKYLADQLTSILRQVRLPDEIIISDDNSTDATFEILTDYRRRFEEVGVTVELIRNSENLGITSNFEVACLNCKNDVLLLSDQDDRWLPERVARVMELFAANAKLVFLNSDAVIIDGNGARTQDATLFQTLQVTTSEMQCLESSNWLPFLVNRNLSTGATCAFRRNLLAVASPFDPRFFHDDWLASVGWLIGETSTAFDPLIEYRLHGENSVGLLNNPVQTEEGTSNPREAHIRWQIDRLLPFVERVASVNCATPTMNLTRAQEYLAFLQSRQRILQSPRYLRIFPVVAMLTQGAYHAHANGFRSAISDIK